MRTPAFIPMLFIPMLFIPMLDIGLARVYRAHDFGSCR